MVEQNIPLQESFAPEVAAALIDLAQLAQQIGSTTIESVDAVADKMLSRLLVLCSAQRGAVLLGVDERFKSELPTLHHKIFRSLALQGVNEEEAHTLLSAFPMDNASVKPDLALTCWLTHKLAIGEFMVERGQFSHDILSPQEIEKLPSEDPSPLLVRQPLH